MGENMKIILGSQSKGRQAVMKELGLSFSTMSADIDEKAIRNSNFRELPLDIARAKSKTLQKMISQPSILITADTVVVQNEVVHEKAVSKNEAEGWIRSFHASPLKMMSAMVVYYTQTQKSVEAKFESKIYFNQIPNKDIDKMLEHEDILKWAGAFGIQDPLQKRYITKIEGDISNVLGLDKEILYRLLREIGYKNI